MKTGLLAPRDFLNIHFLSRTPLSSAYYFYVLFFILLSSLLCSFLLLLLFVSSSLLLLSLSGGGGLYLWRPQNPLNLWCQGPCGLWYMIARFLQDLRVRAKWTLHSWLHVIFLNIHLLSRTLLSSSSVCFILIISCVLINVISFLLIVVFLLLIILFLFFVASLSEQGGYICDIPKTP